MDTGSALWGRRGSGPRRKERAQERDFGAALERRGQTKEKGTIPKKSQTGWSGFSCRIDLVADLLICGRILDFFADFFDILANTFDSIAAHSGETEEK